MRIIDILVVADSLGAAASGNLQDNTYLIDSNGYEGSWNEGSSRLVTVCQDGQELSWGATSINPGNPVSIVGFSGQMISSSIANPQKQGIEGAEVWVGKVQTRGDIGEYQYTIKLSLDGKNMNFDAYIKVV